MCHLRLQWWAQSCEYRNFVQDLKPYTIFCPMFFQALFSMVYSCALTNFYWKKTSPSYQTCHISHFESSGAKDPWNHPTCSIFRICAIYCGIIPLRPHITASNQEAASWNNGIRIASIPPLHLMRCQTGIFNSRFDQQNVDTFCPSKFPLQPPIGPFTDLVALFGARHWADGPGTTHGRSFHKPCLYSGMSPSTAARKTAKDLIRLYPI